MIALALTLVLGGICLCGGMGYLLATDAEANRMEGQAESDGYADGPNSSSAECLDQAYARLQDCGEIAPDCHNAGKTYLRSCLRSAARADPDLCADVPADSTFLDIEFADRFCGARGIPEGDSACDTLASGLVGYCSSL